MRKRGGLGLASLREGRDGSLPAAACPLGVLEPQNLAGTYVFSFRYPTLKPASSEKLAHYVSWIMIPFGTHDLCGRSAQQNHSVRRTATSLQRVLRYSLLLHKLRTIAMHTARISVGLKLFTGARKLYTGTGTGEAADPQNSPPTPQESQYGKGHRHRQTSPS